MVSLKTREVLCELASCGGLPLPTNLPQASISGRKRTREDNPSSTEAVVEEPAIVYQPFQPSDIDPTTPCMPNCDLDSIPLFALPLHGHDLGRLPVYLQPTAAAEMSSVYGPSPGGPSITVPQYPFNFACLPSRESPLENRAESSLHVVVPSSRPIPYPDQAPSDFTQSVASQGMNGTYVTDPAVEQDTLAMWSNAPAGFE